MADAKMTLGYRAVEWNNLTVRGHEFHYSALVDHGLTPAPARISSAKGAPVAAQLYRQGNAWVSCVHLYWGEDPAFIERLLASP
ncbi:MAG: hypothetical protein ACRYFR_03755 [Janthinobacterium lividum]